MKDPEIKIEKKKPVTALEIRDGGHRLKPRLKRELSLKKDTERKTDLDVEI